MKKIVQSRRKEASSEDLSDLCSIAGLEVCEKNVNEVSEMLEWAADAVERLRGFEKDMISRWQFLMAFDKATIVVLRCVRNTDNPYMAGLAEFGAPLSELEDFLTKTRKKMREQFRGWPIENRADAGIDMEFLVGLLAEAYQNISGRKFTQYWGYGRDGRWEPLTPGCCFVAAAVRAIFPDIEMAAIKSVAAKTSRALKRPRNGFLHEVFPMPKAD